MIQDYDGNYYNTVVIGSQEWTVENLVVKHYSNGIVIPNITGNAEWIADLSGAWCNYKNDVIYESLGLLYNWHAVNNANNIVYFTDGGIEQTGWRIPTVNDWAVLTSFIGGEEEGGSLKEIGTTHWKTPNEGATDLYGFKGFGSGNRYIDLPDPSGDGFSKITEFSDWWSSDEFIIEEAPFGHTIFLAHNSAYIFDTFVPKHVGINIKCVRNVVPITRGVSISHDLATRVTPIDSRPYVKFVVNPGVDDHYEFMDMFIKASYKPYSVEMSTVYDFSDYVAIPASKIIEYNGGWFHIKRLPRTIGNKVLIGGSLFVKIIFLDHTYFYDLKLVKTGYKQVTGG
jgi:uncharacterized protein (TIGR02145 family)